jgi:hypothetical protein
MNDIIPFCPLCHSYKVYLYTATFPHGGEDRSVYCTSCSQYRVLGMNAVEEHNANVERLRDLLTKAYNHGVVDGESGSAWEEEFRKTCLEDLTKNR